MKPVSSTLPLSKTEEVRGEAREGIRRLLEEVALRRREDVVGVPLHVGLGDAVARDAGDALVGPGAREVVVVDVLRPAEQSDRVVAAGAVAGRLGAVVRRHRLLDDLEELAPGGVAVSTRFPFGDDLLVTAGVPAVLRAGEGPRAEGAARGCRGEARREGVRPILVAVVGREIARGREPAVEADRQEAEDPKDRGDAGGDEPRPQRRAADQWPLVEARAGRGGPGQGRSGPPAAEERGLHHVKGHEDGGRKPDRRVDEVPGRTGPLSEEGLKRQDDARNQGHDHEGSARVARHGDIPEGMAPDLDQVLRQVPGDGYEEDEPEDGVGQHRVLDGGGARREIDEEARGDEEEGQGQRDPDQGTSPGLRGIGKRGGCVRGGRFELELLHRGFQPSSFAIETAARKSRRLPLVHG